MNHLLQSICPTEENTRPKTCYFVIGEIAIRMFAREKEMLAKGNANERMGNALFESLTEGNSNGQRFAKAGKQHDDQKHHQLRFAGFLDSGCLLRAARRMVRAAYRTRASPCVLLCCGSFRGDMRHAFHEGNTQKRFGPRARYRSDCHIRIRHRLAAGDWAIGRQRVH